MEFFFRSASFNTVLISSSDIPFSIIFSYSAFSTMSVRDGRIMGRSVKESCALEHRLKSLEELRFINPFRHLTIGSEVTSVMVGELDFFPIGAEYFECLWVGDSFQLFEKWVGDCFQLFELNEVSGARKLSVT
mmetsp:Transcript_65646/g.136734  ORF Transcript_65646/g.136734 Transcript_65646/m.136734 type:complete len:133 (-) Transcript_65646:140-538(-)